MRTTQYFLPCSFLLVLGLQFGCISFVERAPSPQASSLEPGMYIFDCKAFYGRGMCELKALPSGDIQVELLENRKGRFKLQNHKGRLTIRDASINFADVQRSLKGDGSIQSTTTAQGRAICWIESPLLISRNHRKTLWTLEKAPPTEVAKFKSREKANEHRDRAKETSDFFDR